ncbi:hypothetical protein PoB_004302400 [Plakobranchus ocellatus]|uniref:Uncharacterized protein n=1 Tax=Plakobranchus ocellatus TaxID=259542 RepID=A0AAV4B8S8_9GAST|nr:hypothetical protein PoB_004302400 [Plakobranchus ocellatus]
MPRRLRHLTELVSGLLEHLDRSRSRSQERARHPRDDRCRTCGKHGRDREHRNHSMSRSRSHSQERARRPRDDRCRTCGKHGRDREHRNRSRSRSRSRSQERARRPRDDRCRTYGKHGREGEHRNRSRSRSRSRSHERARHPRDGRCRAWGRHGRDREESPRERPRESGCGKQQHLGSPRERSHEGKYGRQRSRSSRERSREEEYGELEQQVGSLRSERSRVRRGNRQARRLRKHRNQGGTHQESDRLATAGAGPSLQEREQEDPQLENIVVPSMIFESTRLSMTESLQVTKQKGQPRTVVRGDATAECEESATSAGARKHRIVSQCTIGDCTFVGDFHKSHFVQEHLPSALQPEEADRHSSSQEFQERRKQALEHLRILLECDSLHSLVDLALQRVDLTRSTFPVQMLTNMQGFSRYMEWEIPSSESDWVSRRSPALLLFWRTLVPLTRRLSAIQQASFARWTPTMCTAEAGAEQRTTLSTIVTGTRSGTAADAKGAGASTDAVVEDLDRYLSTAVTITEEEAMEEGSASGQQT